MVAMKPISLNAKIDITPFLTINPESTVEYCFACLLTWSKSIFNSYTISDDGLLINTHYEGEPWLMPYGNITKQSVLACRKLHDDKYKNIPFRMTYITERSKNLLTNWFGNEVTFTPIDGGSDYIYYREKLSTLSGQKYQAKRNFINRFMQQYGTRYNHEPITAQNIDEVRCFEQAWSNNADMPESRQAMALLLDNIFNIDAFGRLLRIDDQIIAFTIGAACGNNAIDILAEKADHRFIGAYPMINQLFSTHDCQNVAYINREEDLGIEGLRKAKLSYNPIDIIHKYEATFMG